MTLALMVFCPAVRSEGTVSVDLDADGVPDLAVPSHVYSGENVPDGWPADRDRDGDLEWSTSGHSGGDPGTDLPQIDFERVWDSGSILSTIWTVEAGDADLDGAFDFAGGHFNPNVIHLFESDGHGGYAEIWNSSEQTPPGAYRDIVFADTDMDGLGEILGAEVSTLGKVMLFEQSGDGFAFVHDDVRETDPSGDQRLQNLLLGDTNKNGLMEIIVVAGGSSPTNGLVSIWEHNGVVGENSYNRIHEYTTVSYLFHASLGDSDNDTWPEIILGLGGFGGNPLYIRRLEYDPAGETWVHTIFESSVTGLPLTPYVADLDEDGMYELAYGSSGTPAFAVVFENTGPNSYEPRFTTSEPMDGNILSLTSYSLSVPGTETFAAGSFEGDVGLWGYDSGLDDFQNVSSLPDLGGAVRGLELLDDGQDGVEELLPALAGPVDQIQVFRRTGSSSAHVEILDSGARGVVAAPNPVRSHVRFRTPPSVGSLLILDAAGRVVRHLQLEEGSARWDRRNARGERVTQGVYFVLPMRGVPGKPSPLVVLR
jgi:hypothetical protein